jgi:hypothetical protein
VAGRHSNIDPRWPQLTQLLALGQMAPGDTTVGFTPKIRIAVALIGYRAGFVKSDANPYRRCT